MERTADIVVVGGGVIGLSIAWRLAQRGKSVALLERGQVGQEASGAAAGMLAPFAEASARGPFSELGLASLNRYPAFIDELAKVSSLDCELVRIGLLRVAEDGGEGELRGVFDAMVRMGSGAQWLDCPALHRMEPALGPSITAAIHSPTEWRVEPRRLVRALAVAASSAGVRIVENAAVTGFVMAGASVTGVDTSAGPVRAGSVLIAGGAWNGAIAGWLGAHIPIKPVRGQIAALGPCFPMPLSNTVYSHHGYLVPKPDGRVIVGSTEDDAGFDTRVTAGGIAGILARAAQLAPYLADAPVQSTWAGLRPMAADKLPVLGRVPGWDNAFVAAGHFRNGILLTPITAELMASLIHDGSDDIDPAFSPDRFAQ